jgi:hypothetical protein
LSSYLWNQVDDLCHIVRKFQGNKTGKKFNRKNYIFVILSEYTIVIVSEYIVVIEAEYIVVIVSEYIVVIYHNILL